MIIEPIPQQPVPWIPQWSWVFDDAFAKADEGHVPVDEELFSTFAPGAEPDVWPVLPPPQSNGGLVVVVATGAMALLFGIMFARWQSARIRITRRRDDYRAAWIPEPRDR